MLPPVFTQMRMPPQVLKLSAQYMRLNGCRDWFNHASSLNEGFSNYFKWHNTKEGSIIRTVYNEQFQDTNPNLHNKCWHCIHSCKPGIMLKLYVWYVKTLCFFKSQFSGLVWFRQKKKTHLVRVRKRFGFSFKIPDFIAPNMPGNFWRVVENIHFSCHKQADNFRIWTWYDMYCRNVNVIRMKCTII